ncbi:MAG TPA: hypothetical protein VLF66_10480, partial [Thermoanaerobaculia bacterium]|nr:hypothetical protein [Thermoanaerobaculia bacterium]
MGSPSRKTPHTRLRRTESANRFQWTEELLELLGVLPDTGVAEKAGVHRLTVAAERRRRGIPPALSRRPPIEWTEEMIALLGTASDQAVAEALGVGRHSVKQKRQGLRIPPFHPPPHDKNQAYPWQPEDLARLGKVSDGTLARALGLNPTTVRTKRHSLGIAPFQPNPPAIEWTPAKIAQLGKSSDRRVAEELGISARSVLAKRLALGIPASLESHPVERNEQVAALLNLPNTEVIRRTGLTWATVQRLRKNLGVPEPTFQDLDPAASGEVDREHSTATEQAARVEALSGLPDDWRSHRAWQPEELALVGTAPDPEIAKRLNRTIEGVKSQRRKLRRVRRALRRWAAEEIELLGTATDPEVAERLGRSISAVRCKRSSLRIPDFLARGLRWQPHEIELLGAAPDQEIAERLGRSQQAVSEKRRKLGIPTFARVDPARRSIARERRLHAAREAKAHRRTDRSVNAAGRRPPLPATQALASRGAPIARRPPRHQTHWSEEHLSLLGEVPDAELARRMGVQPRTVGRERSRRGIPPFNRSPDVQWTPESIWLLGTDSDRRVAEELGIGAHSVTHKRLALGIPAANPQSRRLFPWNPEHVALLGALPDREVARRLGLSSATVARARRSRGIPPFVPAREAIRWTEEQLALLGTEPDRVLAEKLRTSPSTVRKKRNELGIPGRTDSRPVA